MASLGTENALQTEPTKHRHSDSKTDSRRRNGAKLKNTAKPKPSADSIDRLIQIEIIPRLVAAHALPGDADEGERISPAEAAAFAALPITLEASELLTEVEMFLSRGVAPETIFVDLLAPSARRLGELWEEDKADFVEVTMGLWRLQEVMREIAARTPSIAGRIFSPRAALFASMPGEQHSFGTMMVEECFSRAGWDTDLLTSGEQEALVDRLGERVFDLLGLTISCDCHIEPLPNLIGMLRNASKNADIRILIGGRVPNENPGLAEAAGADGTATNARTAIEVADELVADFAPQGALSR